MPGFYAEGEYDLAGFIVGVVERERMITGKSVQPGDVLIGLPSTGCTPTATRWPASCSSRWRSYSPESYVNELKNKVGSRADEASPELLADHEAADRRRSRLRHGAHHRRRHHREPAARAAQGNCRRGASWAAWPVLPIFEHLQKLGNISDDEMYAPSIWESAWCWWCRCHKFKKVQSILERLGEKGYTIGRIVKGERKVVYS